VKASREEAIGSRCLSLYLAAKESFPMRLSRCVSFRQALLLMLLVGSLLSSCRILKGDPRKNCNHPEHGKYMMEQHQKKTGF
jgi:hypothetical protein